LDKPAKIRTSIIAAITVIMAHLGILPERCDAKFFKFKSLR